MTTLGLIHPYLDSSDYSRLSDPRASTDMQRVRDRLIDLASRPGVSFVYSGAHISEMAPLEASYAEAATTRTNLLVKLCGRSTLISPDRLIDAELDRLKHRTPQGVLAVVEDGTWFPDIGQIVTPAQTLDAAMATVAIHEKALEMGLNRQQRRFLKSKAIKGGQLRPEVLKEADGMDLDTLLEHYPMRRDDAEVLKQYVLGKVSAERADQAFLESLRDPSWMMRWFREHHDRLSPIGNWLRGPARKIAEQMIDLVDRAAQTLRPLSAQGWKSAQNDFLVGTINRIATTMGSTAECPDAITADEYCPGISTCLRVMHSSLRNSIGDAARPPEHSDFADAVHAMYAPYVTHFRADRYMAPIIAAHTERYGTAVVRKLNELPDKIEAALSAKAA